MEWKERVAGEKQGGGRREAVKAAEAAIETRFEGRIEGAPRPRVRCCNRDGDGRSM